MSEKRKVGRPKGTTKARGYKVSTGRPKKEDWFMRRIAKGFDKLFSSAFKK
jgi:hypothetical protein